jgi:hypothetical protein
MRYVGPASRPKQLHDASAVMRFQPAHQSVINRRYDGRAPCFARQSPQQMLERKPRIYLPATCKGGHESGLAHPSANRFPSSRIDSCVQVSTPHPPPRPARVSSKERSGSAPGDQALSRIGAADCDRRHAAALSTPRGCGAEGARRTAAVPPHPRVGARPGG